jgi:predicted transposase/invertase (TIGR01784 family)
MTRYLDPRNDLVFKRVFGENPDLAKSFLNALMPLQPDQLIEKIEYLPSELVPTDAAQKRNSIVDTRCTDNFGRQFIVEMQMYWTAGFFKRMLFNASKAFSRQDFVKNNYASLKPVYALAIINDVFDNKTLNFYHRLEFLNHENLEEKLSGMEFVFVELPKFLPALIADKTIAAADKKMAVLWLRFLNETQGEHEIPPELIKSPEINKAVDLCAEGAFTGGELEAYDSYLDAIRVERTLVEDSLEKGLARGLEKGLEKGKAEGKAEIRAEIVTNLHKNGFTPEQIANFTNTAIEMVIEILKTK